jgi:hypothetical protein
VAGEVVDEAAAVRLASCVDAGCVDAERVLEVVEEVGRERDVVDAGLCVWGAGPGGFAVGSLSAVKALFIGDGRMEGDVH